MDQYDNDAQHGEQELSQREYQHIFEEIEDQPKWRSVADKEMDYADGNQLGSELQQRQAELGIPPAVEDLTGPMLLSLQGYESVTRTDWRVTPNGQPDGQDIADALNFKLNQAERESKADRACSKAFRGQIGCGIGWVEVSRNPDPLGYPYRVTNVHRNELHWDMTCGDDLEQCRWMRRQRWLRPERIAATFPEHKELIKACARGGGWWLDDAIYTEGGISTGLQNAWGEARSWTMQEDRWYNRSSGEICLAEVWYRRWESALIIKTPNGRVVEYDETNLQHQVAVASGAAKVQHATLSRMRRSYWLGSHRLFDGPTPYTHNQFPYVPFFGFREDSTGVPYGYVRGVKYAQDSLNSGISKLRWAMNVVRVERTDGAVEMTDEQLRRQIARPDADIVLNREHMAQPGARFEVNRDYQLSQQHTQLLADNRAAFQRVSGITAGFMGKEGTARSGLQEQTQVEQSNQAIAHIMDNFRAARTQVGELLLSMIVEDMGDQPETVVIEGDAVTADRAVEINKPETDENGYPRLSNDLQRTRLKVALEDVPSTNSYRGQQLNAMSEAVKAMPPQYQAAVLPFLVSLMDVPFKRDVVEAIRNVDQHQTPEQIEQQIQQALKDAGYDLKARELELKQEKQASEMRGMDAKTVLTLIQAMFSSMQGGVQVAQMPAIAPIADEMMKAAGYQRPAGGQDPNFPVPAAQPMPIEPSGGLQANTSPQFPAVPQSGQQGIETSTAADNLPQGIE